MKRQQGASYIKVNLDVSLVDQSGLCIGCGTCYAVCPNGAINLYTDSIRGYRIEVDHEKCADCELCWKICPSVDVSRNYHEYRKELNKWLGPHLGIYLGNSKDRDVRYHSSSGGFATELLIFALKKGMIDGALVTRMSKDNALRAEAYLARTEGEILAAMGSKYNISPVGSMIKELGKSGKWAVVGLPCHILAFKKTSRIIRELNDRIVLYVGLFCNHTLYPQATRFLLQKEGVPVEKVESISYRGEGWMEGMLGNLLLLLLLYSIKMFIM
jgi:coenzyme F420 hydrogenase subunit beta